jgi:hypothetical protein
MIPQLAASQEGPSSVSKLYKHVETNGNTQLIREPWDGLQKTLSLKSCSRFQRMSNPLTLQRTSK